MSTQKKNRTIAASSKPATKGRQARTAKAKAAPTAAPLPAERHSSEGTAIPIMIAPEPVPTEAEVSAPLEALPDDASRAKKRSALEAALQVLGETGQAMNCAELIAVMAAKGYWSSRKGRTPASTLYSAILRELQTQGQKARFVKTARGKFARRAPM